MGAISGDRQAGRQRLKLCSWERAAAALVNILTCDSNVDSEHQDEQDSSDALHGQREWFDFALTQSGANVNNPVACCYSPVATLCAGDCPCNNFLSATAVADAAGANVTATTLQLCCIPELGQ